MISLIVSGARNPNSRNCVLSVRLSRSTYFHEFLANAYILYKNQYAGIMTSSSRFASLLTSEKGKGTFNSYKKSPFARMQKDANLELCLRLTQRPGQKPRPAINSPSGLRLLWFEPMVAPAAILLCPITRAAQRNELLWCCS